MTVSQEFIQEIVRASNGLLKYSTKRRDAFRFSLVSPEIPSTKTSEDIGERALRKLKWKVIKKLPPGVKNAASGMFSTFLINWNNQRIKVVFARGGNRGHFFEKDVDRDKKLVLEPLAVKGIINKFLVWNLTKNSANPSRPFTGLCENVGETIADKIIENAAGKKMFVSLKSSNGGSVGNFGYRGASLSEKTGKIQVSDVGSPGEEFLWSIVRRDCYSKGLNSWNKKPFLKEDVLTHRRDKLAVENAVKAALGFGYVIIFRDGNVIDLRTKYKLDKAIGSVSNITVRYPGATKQLSVEVITDKGHKFLFALRNAQGGVIPNTLTLNARWKL